MTLTAVLQTPEASASGTGHAFQDQIPDNFCYGCGPGNPVGLRIRSIWAGNEALCVFQPARITLQVRATSSTAASLPP